MKTPDEEVGEKIVEEFKRKKLLSDANLKKLKPDLISGSLSSSDWRLLFENDLEKKEGSR